MKKESNHSQKVMKVVTLTQGTVWHDLEYVSISYLYFGFQSHNMYYYVNVHNM